MNGRTGTRAARTMVAIGCLGLLQAPAVQAGTLGPTSNDTLAVTIEKPLEVRISRVDDVDFGRVTNTVVDLTAVENFCVFSSTGAVTLTLTSANAAGTVLNMINGSSDLLAYQISVGGTAAQSGVPITGVAANSVADDCANVDNVVSTVSILANDFNAADPGLYADTLTLFVEPE